MNILLAYATYSSGTETASGILAETLRSGGMDVTVKRIADVQPDDMKPYDLVILASPSWWEQKTDGMPHSHFLEAFKRFEGTTFPEKRFAVMGLGDITFAHFCGAVKHLEEWVGKLQGKLVIPSLKVDSFYFEVDSNTARVKEWGSALTRTLQDQ